MTYIYALECPVTGDVRYIGKADRPRVRLRAHINRARSGIENHHSANWIRSLLAQGQTPKMTILAKVAPGEDWAAGADLTNITPGGEGVVLSEDGRERMSEKSKARWAQTEYAARARASLSAAIKLKHQTDSDYRERCARGAKRVWAEKKQTMRFVVDDVRDWVAAQSGTVVFSEDVRSAFPHIGRTIVARHLATLCHEGRLHCISFGVYARSLDDPGEIGREICARAGFGFQACDFSLVPTKSRLRVRSSAADGVDREIKIGGQWLDLRDEARLRFRTARLAEVKQHESYRATRRDIALRTWADPGVRQRRTEAMRLAVKKGRDGRDGGVKEAKPVEPVRVGIPVEAV
ncbi:GIY-YIG nuclease family protein [Microvirga sp. GCM10011540]|uniref:GIY-YIG nuclease family protein n=1 Tax=Microvirga sp. GCM10011540 TaxID=3317338 RepID=UPI003618633A